MGLIWLIAATFWGVAEASLFFVVPDVLLTLATIRFGFRAGLRLSLIAAASAALAGLGMWLWGQSDPVSARHMMLLVPAIGPDLLWRAHAEVQSDWALHLFTGALTGVPYKLYAVEAGARGINPLLFVVISFAARLMRFSMTVAAAELGRRFSFYLGRPRWSTIGWAAAWIAVYTAYWGLRAAA